MENKKDIQKIILQEDKIIDKLMEILREKRLHILYNQFNDNIHKLRTQLNHFDCFMIKDSKTIEAINKMVLKYINLLKNIGDSSYMLDQVTEEIETLINERSREAFKFPTYIKLYNYKLKMLDKKLQLDKKIHDYSNLNNSIENDDATIKKKIYNLDASISLLNYLIRNYAFIVTLSGELDNKKYMELAKKLRNIKIDANNKEKMIEKYIKKNIEEQSFIMNEKTRKIEKIIKS